MNLPEELREFLNKKGVILLIRGLPGTGKTTLALTLLNTVGGYAYITTRKSMFDIERNYSWLADETRKMIFIIDEKYQFSSTEKYGSAFYLLPDSIKYALNLYEEGAINGIIIDSWHTVMEELRYKREEEREREDLYQGSTFFLNLMKLSDFGVNIIIVKEGVEDDSISYVSDGVVTIHRDLKDGRVYRQITLDKLRGTRISKSRYMVSLRGGRFESFSSSKYAHPSEIKEFEAEEIKMDKCIPSKVFDDVFPYRRGMTVTYDFDEYIPKEYHLASFMPTVANFLKNGARVVMIPPSDMDISEMKYQLHLYSLWKGINQLHFLYHSRELEDFVEEVDMSSPEKIKNTVENLIGKDSGEMPPLIVLGYDRLLSYMENNDVMKLADELKNIVRRVRGIMIITGKISERAVKRFCAGISDIYVKFNNISGEVVMYGIKPWTQAYHLDLTTDAGYPMVLLREIV